jgi:hypothetical protein
VQEEDAMFRERALKIMLVLVGLFFSAAIYPAIGGLLDQAHSDTGDTMMMGLYLRWVFSCPSRCEMHKCTAA